MQVLDLIATWLDGQLHLASVCLLFCLAQVRKQVALMNHLAVIMNQRVSAMLVNLLSLYAVHDAQRYFSKLRWELAQFAHWTLWV